MPGPSEAQARAALARIPGFAGLAPGELRLSPLGGLANASFRIDAPAGAFVLRLAAPGSDAFVDRAAEARNARIAARAGLAPEVVFADPESGVLLTRLIEGARPMDAAALGAPGPCARAADALCRLHGMAERFARALDPLAAIARYEALAARRGASGAGDLAALRARIAPLIRALPADPAVPCHGDPAPANILDNGVRAWLIDFEYAGDFDPLWDLAYLAVEAGLEGVARARLFRAYLGREPAADEARRLAVYAALCDLLAVAWGRAQGGAAQALTAPRLARCRARLTRLRADWSNAP